MHQQALPGWGHGAPRLLRAWRPTSPLALTRAAPPPPLTPLAPPQSVPQLLRSADLAAEKGVPGAGKEFTAQLFAYMWEPLVAALKKEPDADIQAA